MYVSRSKSQLNSTVYNIFSTTNHNQHTTVNQYISKYIMDNAENITNRLAPCQYFYKEYGTLYLFHRYSQ